MKNGKTIVFAEDECYSSIMARRTKLTISICCCRGCLSRMGCRRRPSRLSLSPLLAYLTADDKQAGRQAGQLDGIRKGRKERRRKAETVPFILQGDTMGLK